MAAQRPTEGKPAGVTRLRWQEGGCWKQCLLTGEVTVLGSSGECDVVVSHPAISRRHAEIRLTDAGYEIRDLASKNGTFAGGERVSVARVAVGGEFSLGPVPLFLESVPMDDVQIAISLDGTQAVSEMPERKTRTVASGTATEPPILRLLAVNAVVLAAGEPLEWGPCLDELRELLGGQSVCLARSGAVPAVVAVSGDRRILDVLPRLLHENAFIDPGRQDVPLPFHVDLENGLVAVRATGPDPALVLVISGISKVSPWMRWGLECALRLLTLPRTPTAGLRVPRTGEGDPLTFPEGFAVPVSSRMKSLLDHLRKLVPADIPVLLLGETGTGKELLAKTIHLSHPVRRKGPFQAINCAAIPAELLESELFGVERGAATGVLERPGLFRMAAGGVLFLDEIGEMPQGLQTKLLRVLETREVFPVGARKPVSLNARLVSATNADPESLISGSRLRSDLYYRLAGWTLEIPPLRERPEDIPALVEAFARKYAKEAGKRIEGISVRALNALVSAPWPGNIRQLEHEIRRLVHSCPDGGVIEGKSVSVQKPFVRNGRDLRIQPRIDNLERELISEALEQSNGHRGQAAEKLGITRDGLRLKIQRLGIETGDEHGR